jgi:nitronate monooxygenase
LAAQAMGADFGYIGSAFIPTHEARALDAYKDMIVASAAKDIVYSSLFTGVHGNYLAPSIARAGMDPNMLPEGDKSTMNFDTGATKAKAWKDIWGAGQGVGAVQARMGAGEYVAQLVREYEAARARLGLVSAHAKIA